MILSPIEAKTMYFPLIHEPVRVKGRDGLFTVLRAHYGLNVADLLGISGSETIREVPFASLFATFEDPGAVTESPGARRDRSRGRTSSLARSRIYLVAH